MVSRRRFYLKLSGRSGDESQGALVLDHSPRLRARVLCSNIRSKILPMISQELLDILVCPACKKPVAPKPDGKGLKCPECRRVYPIQDDIPIMLVDEATVDPS